MKRSTSFLLSFLFIFISAAIVSAAPIELADWAFNVDGIISEDADGDSMPVAGSLIHDLGTLTWSTSDAGGHSFLSFFDYEIDADVNGCDNEYGSISGPAAAAQSWEIDEPGYTFGNIYDHVLDGTLDNSNSVPTGSEDDVSMAMGWDFTLNAGESALITLVLGTDMPQTGFYLLQTDPDSDQTIYFSSTLSIQSVAAAVPEPGALWLLGTGIAAFIGMVVKKHAIRRKISV